MIFFIAGIYSTYSKIPRYRAIATVMVTQKPGSQSLQNFGNSNDGSQINNKISLIKSRALLKLVVKEFWESNRRNNMFLFNTRNFYPKGQSVRTVVKELFTLGLYDAEKAKKTKVLEGQYTDEIGEKYAKTIQYNLSAGQARWNKSDPVIIRK